jgi:hypothetical protein
MANRLKGPGSPTNREKLPKITGSRHWSVLGCPSTRTNPRECDNFRPPRRETRKGQTGCWSGPDLNFRDLFVLMSMSSPSRGSGMPKARDVIASIEHRHVNAVVKAIASPSNVAVVDCCVGVRSDATFEGLRLCCRRRSRWGLVVQFQP